MRITNAYELMEAVNREILADPKRLWMNHWVTKVNNTFLCVVNEEGVPRALNPHCGTVACYAGWTCLLQDPTKKEISYNSMNAPYVSGVHGEAAENILSPMDIGLRMALDDLFYSHDRLHKPGTLPYAQAVVQKAEKIMKDYEKELRSTPVEIKGRTR